MQNILAHLFIILLFSAPVATAFQITPVPDSASPLSFVKKKIVETMGSTDWGDRSVLVDQFLSTIRFTGMNEVFRLGKTLA